MLGYVRILKDELKVKEYEVYRGLYCTLCRTLGRRYGQLSRLLLSYDVTFLVLVGLAASGAVPEFKKGRCPFNPAKRCNYCFSGEKIFELAAAVSVILFYYNVSDGTFFKRLCARLLLPFARLKFKKAAKGYPGLALEISALMDDQAETEAGGTAGTDEAADASAKALGLIFSALSENGEGLYDFGYAIGRWVYLADAADDIEDDLKTGSFNVFVNRFSLKSVEDVTPEIKESITASLNLSAGAAAEHCKKLELNALLPIIENVLYEGTGAVTQKIINGDKLK